MKATKKKAPRSICGGKMANVEGVEIQEDGSWKFSPERMKWLASMLVEACNCSPDGMKTQDHQTCLHELDCVLLAAHFPDLANRNCRHFLAIPIEDGEDLGGNEC